MSAQLQLALPFDAPAPRRLRVVPPPEVLPLPSPPPPSPPAPVVRLQGGPDAARPCEGCPSRSRCRAPCATLAALLSPPELHPAGEFSSTVLSGGTDRAGGSTHSAPGHRWSTDERFLVQHPALLPPELPEQWPTIAAAVAPRLRAWVGALPSGQRRIMETLLAGASVPEAARTLGITRQVAHKTWRRAKRSLVRRIEEHLRAEGVEWVTRPKG